ncbi:MAG: helix-turn-helix domain-containing protein, partial [Candidatus Odinarchaeia archaeon]
MVENRLEELKLRIKAVEFLKELKKKYTYDELSRALDLPITIINRYVKGRVLPNIDRVNKLLKIFEEKFGLLKEINLREEIINRIVFDSKGYFNNTNLIGDTFLLRKIGEYVRKKFYNRKINLVLTAAVDGIPIATHVANALGVNLVIAKKTREVGVAEFLEESYIPSSSGVMMSLY